MAWFNLSRASEYTLFSQRTLERYIDRGVLRYSRIGREYRFHQSWLDGFLMGFGKKITPKQLKEINSLREKGNR